MARVPAAARAALHHVGARVGQTLRRCQNVSHGLVRAASSSTSASTSLPSVTRGLFSGVVDSASVFPYPELPAETRETLQLLLDPTTKFFATANDAAANDDTASVPASVTAGLRELGAFGLQVPESHNGAGLSNTGYARMVEIVGAHDLGVGIYLGAHQSIGYKGILLYGNQAQKDKYLPALATGERIAAFALTEPGAGSDAAGIKTRAKLSPDGKHWVINGSKIWISNGNLAEVFTLFAKTEYADAATGEKRDKVTAFIVERGFGGVTSGAPEKKMGIKCSPTAEVYLDNVKVPVENVLGEVGGGFKIAMGILNNGRFGMGAALTGTMKTLLAGVAAHACARAQFGKKLREYGVIQAKIAGMASRIYATESLAYLLASNMDRGMSDYQLEAAAAKVLASDAANWCADEALQVMGGLGYMRALPYERWRRDVRIFQIFEGSNEILRQMIGLTGLQAAGKALQPMQAAMKAPLTALPTLLPFAWRVATGRLGFHDNPSLAWAAPPLRASAQTLETACGAFGHVVREVVMRYGKRVVDEQQVVEAVANVAIDLTAGVAVLSRATRAHASGSSTAAQELSLAQLWVEESKHRMNANLRAASGAHSRLHKLQTAVADDAFAAGKYAAEHPLRL